MKRLGWLLPALVACGPGLEGTWESTSMVTVQTPSGPTSTMPLVQDFVLLDAPGLAWRAGGGCDVALTLTGNAASPTITGLSCPLQSSDGLPLQAVDGYQWKQGDVLVVKSARFEHLPNDLLSIAFSLQYRTDPADPSVGTTVDFKPENSPAKRLK